MTFRGQLAKSLLHFRLTQKIVSYKYIHVYGLTPASGAQPDNETFILRAHSCQPNLDESCNCLALARADCIRHFGILIDYHLPVWTY